MLPGGGIGMALEWHGNGVTSNPITIIIPLRLRLLEIARSAEFDNKGTKQPFTRVASLAAGDVLSLTPEMAPSKDSIVFYSSTLPWIRLSYSMLAPGAKGSCLRNI